MYKLETLDNGLTVIKVNMPHIESLTTLLAVGAGSRYETRETNGSSHYVEHMAFKGSKKFKTALEIASLIEGTGAMSNAATTKEYTVFWIKSASRHVELGADVLSSMIREPLFEESEIEREKGVIVEELRMYRDDPAEYVWELYEKLQFGDQPLGWSIGGEEETTNAMTRDDLIKYMDCLYSPKNMTLVFAGKLPRNIDKIAQKYFEDLPKRSHYDFKPFERFKQTEPKVDIFQKNTGQANVVLGVEGYDMSNRKQYAATIMGTILGSGMSSRLFTEIREKRGFAYDVGTSAVSYLDTGMIAVFANLNLGKTQEGISIIKSELEKIKQDKVTDRELIKAKAMLIGRHALMLESTNYLAQIFGIGYLLEGIIKPIEKEIQNIEAVNADNIQDVAQDLFRKEKYNLEIIGPLQDSAPFLDILSS